MYKVHNISCTLEVALLRLMIFGLFWRLQRGVASKRGTIRRVFLPALVVISHFCCRAKNHPFEIPIPPLWYLLQRFPKRRSIPNHPEFDLFGIETHGDLGYPPIFSETTVWIHMGNGSIILPCSIYWISTFTTKVIQLRTEKIVNWSV